MSGEKILKSDDNDTILIGNKPLCVYLGSWWLKAPELDVVKCCTYVNQEHKLIEISHYAKHNGWNFEEKYRVKNKDPNKKDNVFYVFKKIGAIPRYKQAKYLEEE